MLIKNLVQYIKYQKILNKIYREERVLINLSRLFGTEFKQDWIGRMYTVVNPRAQKPEDRPSAYPIGQGDPVSGYSNPVYEFMPDGTLSENTWVEKWVMDKMNVAEKFFKDHNLFELADYELKPVDNQDNWLFIIMAMPWRDLKKSLKRFAIITPIVITLAVIALCVFL